MSFLNPFNKDSGNNESIENKIKAEKMKLMDGQNKLKTDIESMGGVHAFNEKIKESVGMARELFDGQGESIARPLVAWPVLAAVIVYALSGVDGSQHTNFITGEPFRNSLESILHSISGVTVVAGATSFTYGAVKVSYATIQELYSTFVAKKA